MKLTPRFWIPIAGIFLVFGLIALRLGQLQLAMHKTLNEKTKREVTKSEKKRPLRGRILDREGRAMAVTVERPSIAILKKDAKLSRDALASRLSRELSGVYAGELSRRLRGSTNFVWVKRMASLEEGARVKALKLAGVVVDPEPKRLYPYGGMAEEILGTVGIEGDGTGGLEYGLNPLLQGEDVLHIVMKDALGKVFAERIAGQLLEGKAENHRGDALGPFDVYLTIDAQLQGLLEKHLQESIDKHDPRLAMVVVQETNTGAILAMGSKVNTRRLGKFSGFDPNAAASLTFEPGSVVKPLIVAAALDAEVVKENETFDCENGTYRFAADRVIRDHEPYKILNLEEVLAYSSNIGMVKIGQRLSDAQVFNFMRALGFGTKTTLPLAGEAVGILRTPETWSAHSRAMMSFGYEIGTTALQLTNAYSAMGNEGVLLEPQLVSTVKRPRSQDTLYTFKPRRIREALPASIAQRAMSLAESVVSYGTGVKAQLPGYPVAGKTGTAQKLDPRTGKHSSQQVMVTFCGVFPMPKPKYTICAVLDEPLKPKVAYASDIAAPLFAAVAKDVINIFSLLPTVASLPAKPAAKP